MAYVFAWECQVRTYDDSMYLLSRLPYFTCEYMKGSEHNMYINIISTMKNAQWQCLNVNL